MTLIGRLRELIRLRTRLRRWKLYYFPEPPPPPPRNAIEAERLSRAVQYRMEATGHLEVFLRDAQVLFEPVCGDDIHARAALEWLLRAQSVTGCGGFSVGYSFTHGWFPAYPETTGYIIPTLWDALGVGKDERLRAAAIAAADWEMAIQLPNGATRAGYEPDPDHFWQHGTVPAAFNTGQVMQGWNRTFLATNDSKYLHAACRAAEFMVDCIDASGEFVKGLSPGPSSVRRAYYARAAYGLAWTGVLASRHSYVEAARRHLDWVLRQQRSNGWVSFAGFGNQTPEDPTLTHPLAYVAEGLLEAGLVLNEPRYVQASRRIAKAMMHVCEKRSLFLPATVSHRLTSDDHYSCVPGNAQFACLWLRHGLLSDDLRLINTGLKMVDWLKGLQALQNANDGIRGGLAGSWPIDGGYSIFFFVNWTAKFFVDSLLLAMQARRRLKQP